MPDNIGGTPDDATPPDSARPRALLVSAVVLVVIAVAVASMLGAIDNFTRARIQRNAQSWILQRLDALVPPQQHDNDLAGDRIRVLAPDLLGIGTPVTVYRARQAGAPVAVIVHTIAPDGYRGPIDLLVAIADDGTLIGVQVLRHKETPGLGDAFEKRAPDWLPAFRGRSLDNPRQQRWTVRKDGGEFDGFTGATITPRSIIKAVRRTLEYYRAKREVIWNTPAVRD